MLKGKKGIVWGEIAKWIIVGALIIVIILAIIGPTRKALFLQLDKFLDVFRFG